MQQSACLAYRGAGAPHDFDSISGWCVWGCGLRQDGRHTTTAGALIDPGPEYAQAELVTIARRIETIAQETERHEQPTLELEL